MRIWPLVLLFSAGVVALCQSQTTTPVQTDAPDETPPTTEPPQSASLLGKPFWTAARERDYTKLPQSWHGSPLAQGKNLFQSHLNRQENAQRWNGARIDPGMIVRPGKERIGELPAGTPIKQDQFPELVFQPIGVQKSKAGPLLATLPGLKVQPIPRRGRSLR
jgi:hypothetical protein